MNSLSEDELKRKIIQKISKGGLPLEFYVSQTLESNDWLVDQSPYYRDSDSGAYREVDEVALYELSKFSLSGLVDYVYFELYLIIQCKSKDNGNWVFFNNSHSIFFSKHFWSAENQIVLNEFNKYLSLKSNKKTKRKIKSGEFVKPHRSFYDASWDDEKQRDILIYNSLTTVVKSLEYFWSKNKRKNKHLQIYLPLIVFDGHLWSATLTNRDIAQTALKEVDNLIVQFDYQVKQEDIPFGLDKEHYHIPIVTKKYFDTYINELTNEYEELFNKWYKFCGSLKYRAIKNETEF